MSIYLNPISEKKTRRSSICRNTLSILCFLCKLQIPLSLFCGCLVSGLCLWDSSICHRCRDALRQKNKAPCSGQTREKNPFLSNPPIVKMKNPIYSRDPHSLVWQRISLSALRETFNQTEGCSAF